MSHTQHFPAVGNNRTIPAKRGLIQGCFAGGAKTYFGQIRRGKLVRDRGVGGCENNGLLLKSNADPAAEDALLIFFPMTESSPDIL